MTLGPIERFLLFVQNLVSRASKLAKSSIVATVFPELKNLTINQVIVIAPV
tara:strand:+ start:37 stop:189 length:153 start_codon:yes stop_codon:yes gene_type:complete